MLNKKILRFYLVISLLIIAVVLGTIAYFMFFGKSAEPPEVTEEEKLAEILQSLTAPGEGEGVSEEVLQSLTAPK